MKRKRRTNQQIVDQTNALARAFYRSRGYVVPEGYRFDEAHHPDEQNCWFMACIAQLKLTDTDAEDALDNLD